MSCLLASIVTTWALTVTAQQPTLVEYKAAFMYHFIDFVEWPETDTTDVFKVGILGKSDVTDILEEIGTRRPIGDKSLSVTSYADIDAIEDCHLLFITSRYAENLEDILKVLGHRSILTVSDTPGLAREGVAINLILVKDQLKFEINRSRLEKAGLQASAQLLKLAILVEDSAVQ